MTKEKHDILPGRLWKKVILAISAFVLALLLPELALRMVGFHYISGVQYGGLRPQFEILFVPDADLLWKYPTSSKNVNSLGFHGREVSRPKGRHVKRLLFLGDSCADQDYADLIEALLNHSSISDSVKYECVILAAPGYSSYQGKILARKYGKLLQADLAFVSFGWNDHWLAYGSTDEEAGASALRKAWCQIYYRLRLLQAVTNIAHLISNPRNGNILDSVRVSGQQYEMNLMEIGSTFRKDSIPVIFLTAPSAHPQTGVPTYLIEQKLASNPDFVIGKHKEYNGIVRAVAYQCKAYLLDLETELSSSGQSDKFFMADGIHFSQRGLQVVADRIYQFLRQTPAIAERLLIKKSQD